MTSSGRQDGGQGWKWSEPVSLHEAVSRSPVLIRLEEGHRGVQEDLSFSAGDMMALEGLKEVRGRRLVLAHYTSDLEVEERSGGKQAGVYRALLTFAYDSLPDLDVSVLKDPGGHDYRNFVDRHFPDCNWARQQDQLLENMDEHDNMDVVIIRTPRRKASSPRENEQTKRLPPKILPKPRLSIHDSSDTGSPGAAGELTPPPRPPKAGAGPSTLLTGPSTVGTGPSIVCARPSTVGTGPSTFGTGPSNVGAGPSKDRARPSTATDEHIITPTPRQGRQTSPPTNKQQYSPQKKPSPPVTLTKPRLSISGSSDTGSPGAAMDLTPPPGPPKPGALTGPSTVGTGPSEPSTVGTGPSTVGTGPSIVGTGPSTVDAGPSTVRAGPTTATDEHIITPAPRQGRQTSPPTNKQQCSPQKTPSPPITLTKPRLSISGSSDTGSPGAAVDLTPPPGPPKPGALTGPSTVGTGPSGPSTVGTGPSTVGTGPSIVGTGPSTVGAGPSTVRTGPNTAKARPRDQAPQLTPVQPPPRPPRGQDSALPPVPTPKVSRIPEIYPEQRRSDSGDFSKPTIAELTSGQGVCCARPGDQGPQPSPDQPPPRPPRGRMPAPPPFPAPEASRIPEQRRSDSGDFSKPTIAELTSGQGVCCDDTQEHSAEPQMAGKETSKEKKEVAEKQAVRPIVQVQPQRMMLPPEDQGVQEVEDTPPIPTSSASVLERMTCRKLCSRLRKCGMSGLAKVCQEKSLDGAFFVGLSNDTLMKPPFSLDEFEVTTKLRMIKAGWVPK